MSACLTPPGAGKCGSQAPLRLCFCAPTLSLPCAGGGVMVREGRPLPPAGAVLLPQRLLCPSLGIHCPRDPRVFIPTQQGVGLGGQAAPLEAGGLQQGL